MKQFFKHVLINAVLFAVLGFLLNLLPFLQTRPVHDWKDARTVLLTGAVNGILFGAVWYFLEPLVAGKRRSEQEESVNDKEPL